MNEGTLTVESLAGVLAERFGLTQEQARDFVGKVFSTIQESIERDGLVKVKGLGTFKLVRVEARESVNVNTGERVTIESHAKINFTPDSSIRELVNKPFGSFKTVVLSGTGKGEAHAEAAADRAAEEAAKAAEAKAAEEAAKAAEIKAAEVKAAEEAAKAAEEKAAEEAAKSEDIAKYNNNNEENIDKEDESMKKDEEKKVMEEEEDIVEDEDRSTVFWSRMLWTVVVIMLMMGSAYGGYLYGRHEVEEEQERARLEKQAAEQREESERRLAAPEERDSTVIPLDATKIGAMDPNGEKKKEEAASTSSSAKSSSASAGKSSAASTTKTSTAKSSDDVVDYKKYEAMDIRVKTGAYRIVGTDKVVTVKKGQTISSISKTYLGPGMECYVEVYNGLKSGEELKEGAKIKIPKLKWKK